MKTLTEQKEEIERAFSGALFHCVSERKELIKESNHKINDIHLLRFTSDKEQQPSLEFSIKDLKFYSVRMNYTTVSDKQEGITLFLDNGCAGWILKHTLEIIDCLKSSKLISDCHLDLILPAFFSLGIMAEEIRNHLGVKEPLSYQNSARQNFIKAFDNFYGFKFKEHDEEDALIICQALIDHRNLILNWTSAASIWRWYSETFWMAGWYGLPDAEGICIVYDRWIKNFLP